jgi:hypothetical protein
MTATALTHTTAIETSTDHPRSTDDEIRTHERYQRTISSSKRVAWDIDDDVIRGRRFDIAEKFLPDGLALPERFRTLSPEERRFISQIQGRTYANVFGLVERFITAKVLELGREHALGDQAAVEALSRFGAEELKHQQLFRRIETLLGAQMPPGYRFDFDPDTIARAVLEKSTWAVLALTLDIELFTQSHYRQSIEVDRDMSPLFRDVFLFHWKEESQHAILDELELLRHDATLSAGARDRGVDDLIALVAAVDGIVRAQATADTRYFVAACGRPVGADEARAIEAAFVAAYRWQYIHSGVEHPHFAKVLFGLITEAQALRIQAALSVLA